MKVQEVESPKGSVKSLPTDPPKRVSQDKDTGYVTLVLENGDRLTLKEPKAKAFLLFQSYFSSIPAEERSDAVAMVRLCYQCIIRYESKEGRVEKPSFDEWFDLLEMEDVKEVGKAIECFRDVLERFQPQSPV